jgi:hypothetical protein
VTGKAIVTVGNLTKETGTMADESQDESLFGASPLETEARMRTRTSRLGLLTTVIILGAGCSGQVSSAPPPVGGTGATVGTGGTAGVDPGRGGVMGTAGVPGSCTPLAPISRRLWRLSSQQYANATKDLLGLTAPVSVESSADGMSAYALFSDVSLTVSDGLLFSGFYQTAENVITQITPRIPQIAACTPTESQVACATRFAQQFGLKAFRRPLDATEVTNLMKVYTAGAVTDFNTGIGMMIEALILSPSFMYRSELGSSTLNGTVYSDTTLTPYEVATQLGFLFLNSTPDTALLMAATATGDTGLGTPAGIMAQVNRLLALPAVKTNLTNVVTNWFSLAKLADKANKGPALLSALPVASQDQPAIVGELLSSAQQFIADTLFTNPAGKLTDLLTSQKVFVNQRMATLYGLPAVAGPGFVAATWPASQTRIGLLTQPSFLWAASELMNIVAMGDSEETKSDVRMSTQPCMGCHANMDVYSRPLENFDPIGRYRTMDERGRPVTTTANIVSPNPLAPMMIMGPVELAQMLLSSKLFVGCGVQKMASYTVGEMIRKYNTCELNDLRTQFDQSNGSLTSLFSQLAAANFVRARAGGAQ